MVLPGTSRLVGNMVRAVGGKGSGTMVVLKLRVRLLFKENLADNYVIVYLTNGSRDNVWSRTLLDSVQGALLPQ